MLSDFIYFGFIKKILFIHFNFCSPSASEALVIEYFHLRSVGTDNRDSVLIAALPFTKIWKLTSNNS